MDFTPELLITIVLLLLALSAAWWSIHYGQKSNLEKISALQEELKKNVGKEIWDLQLGPEGTVTRNITQLWHQIEEINKKV